MAKKVNALVPAVREQECDHPGGFAYTGRVPCTGALICYLCNSVKDPRTGAILAPREVK